MNPIHDLASRGGRLSDAPPEWLRCRLKDRFVIVNGSTPASGNEEYWDGPVAWATPNDLGAMTGPVLMETGRTISQAGYASCGTSIVPAGSLILSSRAPIGHVAIAGVELCTNQGCKALARRQSTDDPRFWYYLLTSIRSELDALGQGSTFMELSAAELAAVPVAVPPGARQRAIADFLDRKTAALDAVVAEQRVLLDRLAEQRAAVINRAVARGLDGSAAVRDSGVPWLGSIPAHWEVRRLKHISPSQTVGIVVNPSSYVAEEGVPYLYGSNISAGRINVANARRMSADESRRQWKSRLKPGDLVTVRVGEPGVTAVIPEELNGANCASVMITRGTSSFDSHWLCHAMNSDAGRQNVSRVAYGAAQQQFNIAHAVEFVFAVPPLAEQHAIVEHIHRKTARIDAARNAITAQITRLQEYRQSVIIHAVTGRLAPEPS